MKANDSDQKFIGRIVSSCSRARFFERPSNDEWEKTETLLGCNLPPDYKSLISAVGTGNFGSWRIWNPSAKMAVRNLVKQFRGKGALLMRGYDVKVPLYPEPDGFMVLGNGDDGWDFIWSPVSKDWRWVHWKIDRSVFIGASLPEFIYRSYTDSLKRDDLDMPADYLWAGPKGEIFNPVG